MLPDQPRWFRCSGVEVALRNPAASGNGSKQVFPVAQTCVRADLNFTNPAVLWSSVMGCPKSDVSLALSVTLFDADGRAAAIPAVYSVQTLCMLSPRWAQELRSPRYARAFTDAICKDLSDRYGLPFSLPGRWEIMGNMAGRKRKRNPNAAPMCRMCDSTEARALYGFEATARCKEHWRHAEGWARPRNYQTLDTVKRSGNGALDAPRPGGAPSARSVLIGMFEDDLFDLLGAVYSDPRFDREYNTPNVRAHTILCWMHPETSDRTLTPALWQVLYRWNTLRAHSLAQVKAVRARTVLAEWISGNKDLQIKCSMELPRKQRYPEVLSVDDPDSAQTASFSTIFYATKDRLYVATAVWFFYSVFVSKTVQLRIVLRGPDADENKCIDPIELRKMTPCPDGVLRITNAEAVSYQMLWFLLWWNYRHKRLCEREAIVELRVSWLRAMQCFHFDGQVVGPQAAGLIAYALRETCRGILLPSVSIELDEHYSVLDYDGELADKARAELEVIQACLGQDPEGMDRLTAHCDRSEAVDTLVSFVNQHPDAAAPPEPSDTLPPLVSGEADNDEDDHTASQQLSQSQRIRSRSSSIFA